MFDDSKKIAIRGGNVAGNTRRDIEKQLGESIVSPKNAKDNLLELSTKSNLEIEDKKGNHVIFNNKREFWQLLNFLEDDYLSSPVTKINYEVHSKKEIK